MSFGLARAAQILRRAKKRGQIAEIGPGMLCFYCSVQATEYDHRDYNKPLDVDPVCHSCNLLLGPAIPWDGVEVCEINQTRNIEVQKAISKFGSQSALAKKLSDLTGKPYKQQHVNYWLDNDVSVNAACGLRKLMPELDFEGLLYHNKRVKEVNGGFPG